MLGVVLSDYYLVRGRTLQLDDLYSKDPKGQYWYQVGRGGREMSAVVGRQYPTKMVGIFLGYEH